MGRHPNRRRGGIGRVSAAGTELAAPSAGGPSLLPRPLPCRPASSLPARELSPSLTHGDFSLTTSSFPTVSPAVNMRRPSRRGAGCRLQDPS